MPADELNPSVVAGRGGRPGTPRFRAIRVRGVASMRRVEGPSNEGKIDDEMVDDDDDDDDFFAATRRRRTKASMSASSSSADDTGTSKTSYVVRVFARVEGLEKQAIATHGGVPSGASDADGRGADADADAFYERDEACASACRSACERATASANAEEACEMCSAACEDACERRADASGKFEVFLSAGSREAEAWERDLAERRADAARRESAAVLGVGGDDGVDDDGS